MPGDKKLAKVSFNSHRHIIGSSRFSGNISSRPPNHPLPAYCSRLLYSQFGAFLLLAYQQPLLRKVHQGLPREKGNPSKVKNICYQSVVDYHTGISNLCC